MYLIFGLVVFAGRATSRLWCFGWCLAAGLSANLFMWWYGKFELIIVAAIALVWLLACLQRNIWTVIAGTTLFLLLSGVVVFKDPFISIYLKDVVTEASFTFPNTFSTITEIQTASFAQILVNATGSIEMGLVCLTGLAFFLSQTPGDCHRLWPAELYTSGPDRPSVTSVSIMTTFHTSAPTSWMAPRVTVLTARSDLTVAPSCRSCQRSSWRSRTPIWFFPEQPISTGCQHPPSRQRPL